MCGLKSSPEGTACSIRLVFILSKPIERIYSFSVWYISVRLFGHLILNVMSMLREDAHLSLQQLLHKSVGSEDN